MANIFAITTANDTLKLGPNGHTEAVFTVSNRTTRPLRGLAKLRPLGNTKQEWLKLAGESERHFVAGGTQQFTISFEPAPNTPPGKYRFRLDVVSTVNPDEDFTEGPTVVAEVPAPKPPPSKAWMIPVALMMVGTIVVILTRPKKVSVPSVEGQKIQQAREMLTKVQLKFTEKEVPADDPSQPGRVRSAVPKPGDKVAADSTIALEVYGPEATKVVPK
jgi:hypothetical protein